MSALKRFFYGAWETIEVVFISIATVLIIRSFLAQPFLVSGASMEPNFSDGHYLLIDEITYRFREPERGEVIVFRYPQDKSVFFIKRIIGLPGERITGLNGQVQIYRGRDDKKGFFLDESYLPIGTRTPGSFDVQLGDGEYFVLGDNRSYSFDSRNWGSLKRDDIIGVTRLRLLPVNKFTIEHTPQYQ